MLEMKITVEAPDIAVAINNLALALNANAKNGTAFIVPQGMEGVMPQPTDTDDAPQAPAPVAQAPVANPTPATGAPSIANTAGTVAPAANVPVAPVAQTPTVPVAPVANPAQPVAPTAPTGAPTYTLEMISRAGSALVDAGKMDALCNLLAKYQVEALTALDPAQYGAIAADLRALGAQI